MSRNICIAGASRGLGFFLAKRYLALGDRVFAGVRDISHPNLQELAAAYGDRLVPIVMDVVSTASVTAAAEAVAAYTQTLDILICNAAIHSKTSFLGIEETDLDECLEVYDVNAVGPIRVAKAFLPMLTGGSQLVNISSESGSMGICGRDRQFGYCMSKAALNMGSKLLQNLLLPRGVKVLVIHPGWMRTDMGGSNAHRDPWEAAVGLADLFAANTDPAKAMFLEFTGEELPW